MDSAGFVSNLPEWGATGALLFIVIFLVKIFMDYVKDKDSMLIKTHKECEDKLAAIASDWKDIVKENTEASHKLEGTVTMLVKTIEKA